MDDDDCSSGYTVHSLLRDTGHRQMQSSGKHANGKRLSGDAENDLCWKLHFTSRTVPQQRH